MIDMTKLTVDLVYNSHNFNSCFNIDVLNSFRTTSAVLAIKSDS